MALPNIYWQPSILRRQPILVAKYPASNCDSLLGLLPNLKYHKNNVSIKSISRPQSNFTSYSFDFNNYHQDLEAFKDAFDYLLKIYIANGFRSKWSSVVECHKSLESNDSRWLNPLIFEYVYPSKFEWHAHSARFQNFQLVMNLSLEGRDYQECLFEVAYNKQHSWKFESNHYQGSIISFPYSYAHRLTNLAPVANPKHLQRHLHLIMPLHPKKGFRGSYIPLEGWPKPPIESTLTINNLQN